MVCSRRKIAWMSGRVVAGIVALLLWGMTAHAHHSIAGVYDASRRVRLDGIITAFQFVNPHPYVELDVKDASGKTEPWRLELDNRFELAAVGMTAGTLKPGDRVVVAGSAARDRSRSLYVRELERPADGFLYEQVGSSPRVRLPAR